MRLATRILPAAAFFFAMHALLAQSGSFDPVSTNEGSAAPASVINAQAGLRAATQNQPPSIGAGIVANDQGNLNSPKSSGLSCCLLADPPQFSLAPGAYSANTSVKLKGPKGAQIYYTTDGWTPTTKSSLYTGPLPLNQSETIQAIAVVPGYLASAIASADYTVANPPAQASIGPAAKQISPTEFELPRNAELPLVFTSKVDSETAKVGDRFSLALAADLVVEGKLLAPKGAPAAARIVEVGSASHGGLPGVVAFTVVSIQIQGVDVSLAGTKTRVGICHDGGKAILLMPVANSPKPLPIKGDPVQILPGTPVTALVAATTEVPLKP